MLLVSTYVAQSAIEGIGVFAGEFVANGSVALGPQSEIRHLHLHANEIEGLPAHMQVFVARYSLSASGYAMACVVLDCDNGKFMNHSLTGRTPISASSTRATRSSTSPRGKRSPATTIEFDPTFSRRFHGGRSNMISDMQEIGSIRTAASRTRPWAHRGSPARAASIGARRP